MSDKLNINLVTPNSLFLSAEVDMIVISGVEGDFGVLKAHAPLISMIKPGVIEIHSSVNDIRKLFVMGGYAEVNGTDCTILAEELVDLSELNRSDLETEVSTIEQNIIRATNDLDAQQLEQKLASTLAKLEVV